ncbi:ABC transporter permease [Methanocella sp. CWC-04]|uniref:ABC transporter permease n=1 Tax=Methanooceanicella nereidis TaxID=2052831 RepID=A0AAP2W4X5_9EURY|nr:FtsX-like permease family protein [Methanocella sp. CWC-04]MCD1293743.1 ABC transporter permease [Methanocella sp. CWC-04]
MLDISFKNMWQRRTRTLLTIVSIAVCIMLFIVLSTATFYMNKSFTDSMGKFAGQMYVKSPSPMSAASAEFPPVSSSLPMEKAGAILALDGVDKEKSAALLLISLVPSQFQNGPPQVMAVGIPEGSEKAFYSDVKFSEGSGTFTAKDQAILGSEAAKYYNVKAGDRLALMNKELDVIGVAESSESLITNGMVMIPLSTAQDMFNRPSVTTVLLAPVSIDSTSELASKVSEKFPELEVMTQKEMMEALEKMMAQTKTFMGMINMVMLIVAGVVTLMVMIMSVSERTKELGMLRAIGASRSKILVMVMEESLIICLAGAALGILLSFLLMKAMFGGAFASIEIITQAILFMTTIGVIAALYPAVKASKIQPLEALRYE